MPCRSIVVASTRRRGGRAFKKLGGPIAVVKAQIHAGGRGKGTIKDNPKQRGVQLVRQREEAARSPRSLLGNKLVTIQTGPEGQTVRRCSSKPAATSPASCTWAS